MYAVLKLITAFTSTNTDLPLKLDGVDGCVGLIPVFSTREQAMEHCQDGKYQIVEVSSRDAAIESEARDED